MMDMSSIFHDRRPAPEPESGLVEVPEVEHDTQDDPRMDEETLIGSVRVPSAHPGPGTMVMGRKRDADLCEVCMVPLFEHGAGTFERHMPTRLNRVTPGVHPQADRNAEIQRRHTARRDLDN
jgi:hypothetical protein